MSVIRRGDHEYSRHLLKDFLVVTLGVVLFAFLPELIAGFSLSDDTTWRIANGLFGLAHLVAISASLRRDAQASPWRWAVAFCGLSVILLKLFVGAGFLLGYAYHIYLLGLIWLIGVAIYRFAEIVMYEDS